MIEEKSEFIENQSCEEEIAEVLCVVDKPVDISQQIKPPSPQKQKIEAFVPGGIKTRGDLIRKIKESCNVVGNHAEIKSMQLHRRRKGSLECILREQVAQAVEKSAERDLGIPEDQNGRLEYAIDMLYNFDICVCKALEKALDFVEMSPVEITGFAECVDQDPRIQKEIKQSFRDWINESEGMRDWVSSCASPSTRLICVHLYPLMHCAKKKGTRTIKREIPVGLQFAAAGAKLRAVIDPPQGPLPPVEEEMPGIRLV
jgi:citrate lyase gamma subunit